MHPARRIVSRSPQQTLEIGRLLGGSALPGTLIALDGPLGAGKTQLTKGIAQGLGVAATVNSPTFILMNEYAGRLPLFHVDAYRLSDAEEGLEAGLLDERQAAGVTVVEWAERLAGWLPPDRLEIQIAFAPDGGRDERRILHWRVLGAAHARVAAALERGAAA